MSEPVYKTSRLDEVKRILSEGVQPLHVELIDDRFILFTFPGTASPHQQPQQAAAAVQQ